MRGILTSLLTMLAVAGTPIATAGPGPAGNGTLTRVALGMPASAADLPSIAMLDCAEMQATLARIDRFGYRGYEPITEGHPHHDLFVYEDALAAAFFAECTYRQAHLD